MSSPLPFSDLREFFEDEEAFGQLCDLCIVNADRSSWSALFQIVVQSYPYQFAFDTGGENSQRTPAVLPTDAGEVLALSESDSGPWPDLSFNVGGAELRVHFFSPTWIELDFWRATVSRAQYGEIASLMRRLGDAARRDTFMSPEGAAAEAVMVYEAAAKKFRQPLHGVGSEGRIRKEFLERFSAAMHPMRDPTGRGAFTDEVLRGALTSVEAIRDSYTELTLQDELLMDERRDFDRARSSLAAIVRPPAGVDTARHRSSYEHDVVRLARRYAS